MASYENLYNNNGIIWMQPICYADKSTHTMFEIDTDSDSICRGIQLYRSPRYRNTASSGLASKESALIVRTYWILF